MRLFFFVNFRQIIWIKSTTFRFQIKIMHGRRSIESVINYIRTCNWLWVVEDITDIVVGIQMIFLDQLN